MSADAVVAAVVLGAAVALLLPVRAEVSRTPSRVGPLRLLLLLMPLVLVVLATLGAKVVVLSVIGGVSGLGALDLIRRERRRRAAAEVRRSVVELGEALAGEIRSGRAPTDALGRVADQFPLLRETAETARLGGEVPGSLRVAAARPGAEALGAVAAAWHLSVSAGAGLADALDRSTTQARAELSLSTVVDGELSSARATARLLAVMPFFVLALGRGMGFDPWGFLFFSWPGISCLGAGVVLSLVGLRWVDRIGHDGGAP